MIQKNIINIILKKNKENFGLFPSQHFPIITFLTLIFPLLLFILTTFEAYLKNKDAFDVPVFSLFQRVDLK